MTDKPESETSMRRPADPPEVARKWALKWAVAGSVAAVVVSPLLVLITRLPEVAAIWLAVLFGALWYLCRMDRKDVGLTFGEMKGYGLALAVPTAAVSALVALAWAHDATALPAFDPLGLIAVIGAIALVSFYGGLLAWEGLFRGWLWAMLERAGLGVRMILVWTTGAFTIWHLGMTLLVGDFAMPVDAVPVYLANIFLLGLAWGMLRHLSGSIIVPSLAHAVWNGLSYKLFGYGIYGGLLGVDDFALFGPERGIFGIAVNVAVVIFLWHHLKRQGLWQEAPQAAPAE